LEHHHHPTPPLLFGGTLPRLEQDSARFDFDSTLHIFSIAAVAFVAKMLRRMEEGRMGIVAFTCTSYVAQRDRVISGLDTEAFQAFLFLFLWFCGGGFFLLGMFPTHVLHLYGVYPRPTHDVLAFSDSSTDGNRGG